MLPRPPRSTRSDTLFPYTSLFRCAHKRVYQVELSLISPNILETNQKARYALAKLNELFAQDAVSIVLEHESGELSVPKNPVEDYVDYIAEGEGQIGRASCRERVCQYV